MIIPKNEAERENFYWDLINKCMVSRSDRMGSYATLRSYFLFGAGPDKNPATFNKIFPHIDQLTSFMFASDTAKFSIELGAGVDKTEYDKTPPMIERLNNKWHDSNGDITFGQAVTWSLVFNTCLIKLVQRGKDTYPFIVDPSSFGVLREDITQLDRQEAFVHTYYTTKSQLTRDLTSHPNKNEILRRVSETTVQDNSMPSGIQRIILSNFTPTMRGNASFPMQSQNTYRPKTAEEVVEMYELWVWNDDISDYQLVTMADGGVCVFDRANTFLRGEHPFIQICPNPAYDYFWGYSEVEKLCALQDLREHRLTQIRDLLDRQANPPTALTGWIGNADENNFALSRVGGVLSTQEVTGKVEQFRPQIPQDTFAEIREIDTMFSEMSAITSVLAGRGEKNVRSGGHASDLARLGSSRPKKRALIIEDALEAMATKYLKLDQQHDATPLKTEKGQSFISHQLTENFMVKVDAHSSSPVFMEDVKSTAIELFKAKALTRERLIEMLHPPMMQQILEDLKIIEKKEAEAAKAQAEAQAKQG